MTKVIFFSFFFCTFLLQGQTDTIFKKDSEIIICFITYVNDNNIFYNTKKVNGKYISVDEVQYYSQNGKRAKPSSPQIKKEELNTKDSLIVPKDSSTLYIVHPKTMSRNLFKIKMNRRDIYELEGGEVIKCVFYNEGELKIMLTEMFKVHQISYQIINLDVEFSKTYYIVCSSTSGETKLVDEEIGEDIILKKYLTIFREDLRNSIIKSPFFSSPKSGTGFALSETGLVITNYHVIDKAKKIELTGINGRFTTSYSAKVIVEDQKNDLAILQLENKDIKFDSIPYTIRLKGAEPGEGVYVLGYPMIKSMGEEVKLTTGVISAKTGYKGDVTTYQVSAPVQGGNSGGPLFDKQGNLIGVINAKILGAEGVTYAIKTGYINSLIDLLPSNPLINMKNKIEKLPLEEQVKQISKFVYIIKVSN